MSGIRKFGERGRRVKVSVYLRNENLIDGFAIVQSSFPSENHQNESKESLHSAEILKMDKFHFFSQ